MIERVGIGTIAKASSGDLVPGLPAGIALNDILLCYATSSDNIVFAMDPAWSDTLYNKSLPGTPSAAALWHRYDGVTPPDTTVTYTGAVAAGAYIVAYRGCHAEDHPFDSNMIDDGMGNNVEIIAHAQAGGPIAVSWANLTSRYVGNMVVAAWHINLFGTMGPLLDSYPDVTFALDDGFTGVGGSVGFGFADGINPSGDPPGVSGYRSSYSGSMVGYGGILLLRQDGAVGPPSPTAHYDVSRHQPGATA
jgi:hypothetical protein